MLEVAGPPGRRFHERLVAADGFDIRYWEAGDGPTIVWLHGAGGPEISHAQELLAARHRVVIFEMPGWGGSPENDRTQSAADLARTMAVAIVGLGLDAYHLWGTSMGGIVSLWLAANELPAPTSLILEAPGAFRSEAPRPADLTPARLQAAFNRHPERVPWREPRQRDPRRWPLVMRVMGPDHDTDLEAALERIEVPTLVMFGTADGLFPPHMGRLYKKRMPRCTSMLVYDAGHDIQGDRPEAVADVVADFVARGPTFVVEDRDSRVNR